MGIRSGEAVLGFSCLPSFFSWPILKGKFAVGLRIGYCISYDVYKIEFLSPLLLAEVRHMRYFSSVIVGGVNFCQVFAFGSVL